MNIIFLNDNIMHYEDITTYVAFYNDLKKENKNIENAIKFNNNINTDIIKGLFGLYLQNVELIDLLDKLSTVIDQPLVENVK